MTTGLKRLNDSVLCPGDVILTTTTAAISKVIRAATGGDISHAMVYVENRSVIDATGDGVHARNTQRLFFEDECTVHAMRLRNSISDPQLQAIRAYLRRHIGTQYSVKEAILTSLGGARQWSKKQFCSRLVAQAFASTGIELVADCNFCSPANLKDSLLLVPVSNATVPVTADEAVWWRSNEDVPQRMREAINAILEGARIKDPTIQIFEDLHSYLVRHPQDDNEFCEMLEKSGYLLVWKIEWNKNRWQYDFALMSVAPAAQIEDYCWSVLANEESGPNRYIVNRGGYMLLWRQTNLRFFRMMLDLYDHLAMLHHQRVETAARWLEINAHLPPSVSRPLIPHTPEWFSALEQWDPPKAMMTRNIIKLSGRSDICSICGDDPAKDYRLVEELRPPGGVDTLRLCDDCVEIRRANGDLYVALSGACEVSN